MDWYLVIYGSVFMDLAFFLYGSRPHPGHLPEGEGDGAPRVSKGEADSDGSHAKTRRRQEGPAENEDCTCEEPRTKRFGCLEGRDPAIVWLFFASQRLGVNSIDFI